MINRLSNFIESRRIREDIKNEISLEKEIRLTDYLLKKYVFHE